MPKTGLYGFGAVNESVFFGKLNDLLGKTLSQKELQQMNAFIQKELDAGRVEGLLPDRTGASVLFERAMSGKNYLAKCVSLGLEDRKNQALFAYVTSQPGKTWSPCFVGTKAMIGDAVSAYHIGYLKFRSFKEANDFICGLQELLLPGEQWGFSRSEENPALVRKSTRYQILESYLRHTFSKLMQEYRKPKSYNYGKIVFSKDRKYCYFNTGLLTRYAQELFLTGEVSGMKDTGIFTCVSPRFIDSKIELTRSYNFNQADIDPGPSVATFFKSLTEIVYDPNLTIDFTDAKLEHIIDDGIARGRFPRKYTVNQFGKEVPPWSLAQSLKTAIQTAELLAKRNYKYVIPQYRPASTEIVNGRRVQREGQIQFLMPIYLSADYTSPPDFSLVLSRKDEFYIPETILLLPWAYNNARILCRPDISWLTPSLIDPEELIREMEEEEAFAEAEPEFVAAEAEIPAEKPKKAEKRVKAAEKSVEKNPQVVQKANKSVEKSKSAVENKKEQPKKDKKSQDTEQKDSRIGRVFTVNCVGTTASKALEVKCRDFTGTLSQKQLSDHKPAEFHGISCKVKVLSRNSNGNTYQCEFAEEIDGILARKSAPVAERAEKKEKAPVKEAPAQEMPKEKKKKSLSGIWSNLFTVPNPESFDDLYVGLKCQGTVKDCVPYGVFVDIGCKEGNVLLHKSQYAENAVPVPGDSFTVWVYAVDKEQKRVQVTMHKPE